MLTTSHHPQQVRFGGRASFLDVLARITVELKGAGGTICEIAVMRSVSVKFLALVVKHARSTLPPRPSTSATDAASVGVAADVSNVDLRRGQAGQPLTLLGNPTTLVPELGTLAGGRLAFNPASRYCTHQGTSAAHADDWRRNLS